MSWNIGVPPRDKTHPTVVDKNGTLKSVSWDVFFWGLFKPEENE